MDIRKTYTTHKKIINRQFTRTKIPSPNELCPPFVIRKKSSLFMRMGTMLKPRSTMDRLCLEKDMNKLSLISTPTLNCSQLKRMFPRRTIIHRKSEPNSMGYRTSWEGKLRSKSLRLKGEKVYEANDIILLETKHTTTKKEVEAKKFESILECREPDSPGLDVKIKKSDIFKNIKRTLFTTKPKVKLPNEFAETARINLFNNIGEISPRIKMTLPVNFNTLPLRSSAATAKHASEKEISMFSKKKNANPKSLLKKCHHIEEYVKKKQQDFKNGFFQTFSNSVQSEMICQYDQIIAANLKNLEIKEEKRRPATKFRLPYQLSDTKSIYTRPISSFRSRHYSKA